MLNQKAFFKLSYGLYVISSCHNGKNAGCVVNTFAQVTAEPARVTVAVNKENFTTGVIQKAGRFEAVALAQSASMELIGMFGFHTSADTDKFKGFKTQTGQKGIPYICEQVTARFQCRVIDQMDAGTHLIFLAEVEEAEVLSNEESMTYAYYHQVKKGLTPPKASSYQPKAAKGFRCKICGYVLEAEELPEGFTCPICGRSADFFEKITD